MDDCCCFDFMNGSLINFITQTLRMQVMYIFDVKRCQKIRYVV